jgi:hypothetical protein
MEIGLETKGLTLKSENEITKKPFKIDLREVGFEH